MGNSLIKPFVRSQIVRPLKNFNVEDRAMKVVSRDKPTPAPTHAATKKIMEDIKNDPEILKRGIDPVLSGKLSQVYLTSQGDNPIIQRKSNLPTDRKNPVDHEFGFEDPVTIPEGKVTLRQTLQFLSKNQNDPEKYKAEEIAAEYKLDIETTQNILKHFRPFVLHTPNRPAERSPLMKAFRA